MHYVQYMQIIRNISDIIIVIARNNEKLLNKIIIVEIHDVYNVDMP